MNTELDAANTEEIWGQFYDRLRGYVKRRIPEQDVDDVMQDIFIKIHQNVSRVREKEKIISWAFSLTKNVIADFYRKRSEDGDTAELTQDIMDETEEKTDIALENNETAHCVTDMVRLLPAKYKDVILMTEYQNLSQKEVSRKLGITVPGVKTRLMRAKAKVKDMLLDCCVFELDKWGNILDYKKRSDKCC